MFISHIRCLSAFWLCITDSIGQKSGIIKLAFNCTAAIIPGNLLTWVNFSGGMRAFNKGGQLLQKGEERSPRKVEERKQGEERSPWKREEEMRGDVKGREIKCEKVEEGKVEGCKERERERGGDETSQGERQGAGSGGARLRDVLTAETRGEERLDRTS